MGRKDGFMEKRPPCLQAAESLLRKELALPPEGGDLRLALLLEEQKAVGKTVSSLEEQRAGMKKAVEEANLLRDALLRRKLYGKEVASLEGFIASNTAALKVNALALTAAKEKASRLRTEVSLLGKKPHEGQLAEALRAVGLVRG